MKNEFYNTINAKGAYLKKLNESAISQRDRTLLIFKMKCRALTPSEVLIQFPHPLPPLTSIRRAISNLTNDGYLKRLDIKKTGMYQAPEHYWKLIKTQS